VARFLSPRPSNPAGGGPRGPATAFIAALNYAFEGVVHVVRTERNMQIHIVATVVVLLGALWVGVTREELLALIFAATLVIVAEMFNTAVEAAIDVATSSFDPRAKIAKDVAAGAVLITAVCALAVAYVVFVDRIRDPSGDVVRQVRESPLHLSVIALFLVVIAVIAIKAWSGRGEPLRGGLPSGHAAIAFGCWAAIVFVTSTYAHAVLIGTLAFVMAALVAQSRVEAGIHSVIEVIYGAVVGVLVTLIVFQAYS
jgi:diacylglycerol kinase (ATP)